MGCLPNSFFSFSFSSNRAILIGQLPQKKKTETWKALHNINFYVRMTIPISLLAHRYSWEGKTLGKGYGIKWGAIGNSLWGHIENLENPNGNLITSLGTPHSPCSLTPYYKEARSSKWRDVWSVDTKYTATVNQLTNGDGWFVGWKHLFHWIHDQWLTTLITYVSTIHKTSTYVVATKCFT
jgi:hypothetical protein